jgi:hypothetical protein
MPQVEVGFSVGLGSFKQPAWSIYRIHIIIIEEITSMIAGMKGRRDLPILKINSKSKR